MKKKKKKVPNPLQIHIQKKYRLLITPTKQEKEEKTFKKYKNYVDNNFE